MKFLLRGLLLLALLLVLAGAVLLLPPPEALEFGRALETAMGAEPAEAYGGLAEQLGPDIERVALEAATVMAVPGFPGLAMVALGGHTPGSTLFAVRVDGHYWLFSGDITNSRAELVEDRPKHWLYSTFIVPEDTARTAQLRGWLRSLDARDDLTVLPAHDLAAMQQYLPAPL